MSEETDILNDAIQYANSLGRERGVMKKLLIHHVIAGIFMSQKLEDLMGQNDAHKYVQDLMAKANRLVMSASSPTKKVKVN